MKHFFDIGSNAGQTFDWLATQPEDYRASLFWCFEPSPRHFAQLIARCAYERTRKREIVICPFAISGKSEMLKLYEKDDLKGDSLHATTASDHATTNRMDVNAILVATRELSGFIHEFTKPGDEIVIDMDAEGAEYGILQNLLCNFDALKRVTRIIAEFHFIGTGNESAEKARLIRAFDAAGIKIEVRGFVP